MKKILSVTSSITVLKSAKEVYAAVLEPSPFFVARASGPLAAGKTIRWIFPEVPGQPALVDGKKVSVNKLIRFEWDSATGGKNKVEFTFKHPSALNPKAKTWLKPNQQATTVTVTESGWPDTAKGRENAIQNAMGWTHMICALKSWLEFGKNLRTGAYIHYKF